MTMRAMALAFLLMSPHAFATGDHDPTMPHSTITYPDTRRTDDADTHFGQRVADPYRWLEDDVRSSPDVAGWVGAQNEITNTYLHALPGRDVFKQRLTALFDHALVTAPRKQGGRYFYTRKSGLENQATLYVRDGLDGDERTLIDPNTWSDDGATALAEWSVSRDGSRVAYAVQDGGSDWRTVRVLDAATGEVLDDAVEWARFTTIEWAKDAAGFFYSRYPAQDGATSPQTGVANHAVYYHALGTPQSQDRLLYATPEQPHLIHNTTVTSDGRYAAIHSTPGSMSRALTVVDLEDPAWTPRTLVENFDSEWALIGNTGTTLFFATTLDAERRRTVSLDLADATAEPVFVEVVAEQEHPLNDVVLIGDRLIVSYLVDAKTEMRRFRLDGTADGDIPLPGIGSAGGFRGDVDDDEAFFVFTSYNAPTTIYRYDVATGEQSVWAEPKVMADMDSFAVDQHFYASKDGTRVPMFVLRRKDVTAPAPTLLYAYGGFGISSIPVFSPAQLAWVEQGGVFVVANIRGGGEYGEPWHHAGRLDKKQNVFDDFIAAGEYLKAEGITSADGLAVHGESNGGLLVGAVVNQRPDLFAAALPGVGVMDMLRYHRFTGGQLWVPEFGDPSQEANFRNLFAYSPYHNIESGTPYPAILATTADADNRVIPGHTFKYIAAIQAADVGPKPHLVRIETRAGHGAGKPTDKMIDEIADMWAFAARWTGLDVRERAP